MSTQPKSLPHTLEMNSFEERLKKVVPNQPKTVIGLMSGTSMDSIDGCCGTYWLDETYQFKFEILGTYTHSLPTSLKERIIDCIENNGASILQEICKLNVEIGELFAETALGVMKDNNLSPQAIDWIGSHGQTVYHIPPSNHPITGERQPGSTLQIGSAAVISERTQIPTISDFRPRDMAAGGQGAPLVCFADQLLFSRQDRGCCVQNIGGISNVTVLPTEPGAIPTGFDTGPGNILLDQCISKLFGKPYDDRGGIAASGNLHEGLFNSLKSDPYLQKQPPKTTGREYYSIHFLEPLLAHFPEALPQDIIHTLTYFTAFSIYNAYQHFIFPHHAISEMVIGGGGLYNATLMDMLNQFFHTSHPDFKITDHEAYGVPSKYKEALAFGILAWATGIQLPNNIPSCTGATHPVILGQMTPV